MVMSKDLPEDVKRNNLLTGMMLGDNQNAMMAQVITIRKQKESQDRIEELEAQLNSRYTDVDGYIVKSVNASLNNVRESRQEEVAEALIPLVTGYVKHFHKGVLPKEFLKLNPKILHPVQQTCGVITKETSNGVHHPTIAEPA